MAAHPIYEDLDVFVADAASGAVIASRHVKYTVPIDIRLRRLADGRALTPYEASLATTTALLRLALASAGRPPPGDDSFPFRYDTLAPVTVDEVLWSALHLMWGRTGQVAFFLCSLSQRDDLRSRRRPALGTLGVVQQLEPPPANPLVSPPTPPELPTSPKPPVAIQTRARPEQRGDRDAQQGSAECVAM